MCTLQKLPCVCGFIISQEKGEYSLSEAINFFSYKSIAVYTNISDFFKEPNIQVWITDNAH